MLLIPLLLALSTATVPPLAGDFVIAAPAVNADTAAAWAAVELLSARDRGDWARYVDLLSVNAIRDLRAQLLRMVDPAEGGMAASEVFALGRTETLEGITERDQVIRGLRYLSRPQPEARWVVLAAEAQPDGSVRVRAHRDGEDADRVSVLHFVRENDAWRAKAADDYVRGVIYGALEGQKARRSTAF